jgi:hypothetical protein
VQTIEVKPHEIEAMRQLVLNVRAIATTIIADGIHRQRLLNWAQMIEDVLSRMETVPQPPPRPDPSVPFKKG